MNFVPTTTTRLRELPFAQSFTERAVAWLRLGANPSDAIRNEVFELVVDCMGGIETHCRQPLFARPFTVQLSGFINGTLPTLTAKNLTIKYKVGSTANAEQTLDESLYSLLPTGEVIFGDVPDGAVWVQLSYTAGYADDDVPGDLKTVLLWQITDRYDNRSDGKQEFPQKSHRALDIHRLPI